MNTLESNPVAAVGRERVMAAGLADRDAVLDVLVRAFQADPVVRWTFPDRQTYPPSFRAFAAAFGGRAFEQGTVYSDADVRGAAMWLPPGVGPDEEALIPLVENDVPRHRLKSFFRLLEQMGRHHPEEPHWYLPLIGVDPIHQGRGLGSALLRHATQRLDRAGMVAYLESTNPLNVPLYERHGFKVCGTIQVADIPPVYPMVRSPR